ncbi:MAG: imidazole glycerol phosphate synthase subunit HisH [Planctomycetota bacterium]
MRVVHVVDTGLANVASVVAGLERAGASAVRTRDARDVERAELLVLPGVGSFGAGMGSLREAGVVEPLRERVVGGRATLAICLGMQMLFEGSDEAPEVEGVGAIPGRFGAFPEDGQSTHFGWNSVEAPIGARFIGSGFAYFAHSYRTDADPGGWSCARTELNGVYTSALERDAVLACQFHPELSGVWGRGLLSRWVTQGEAVVE